MITTADTPEVLRRKIIHGLDSMGFDELKRLHQIIAGIAVVSPKNSFILVVNCSRMGYRLNLYANRKDLFF